MKNFIQKYISLINKKGLALLFVWAFIVNFIVETLGRFQANGVITGNIWGGFVAIFTKPYVILYGTIVIMFTLSFALFFKRKYFAMILISSVWLIFGLANFVLLSYRVTPFSATDFHMLDDAMAILTQYASKGAIIGCILLFAVLIVCFVFIAIKAPKERIRNYKRAIITVLLTFLVTLLCGGFGKLTGLLDREFPNLADAYIDNGFAYCFCSSIFDTGIDKPSGYSKDMTTNIVSDNNTDPEISEPSIRPDKITLNKEDPNIIFLQLESFFDITSVSNLEFSEDPVPYFRSLIESCPSGYLSMPCIGAGTANTEFEVITGMNIDFFGPGEYPYKTILKDTSCESLAFNFHDNGYATHAVHNNRASFYSRHSIFANLGFDEFTTLELMDISEYTPNGWAKDKYLTKELLNILSTTENRDFIYTISVQGHGKYPSSQLIENPKIKLLSGALENKWYGIEYYANQINEMDDFLRELTEALEAYDEPVILVAYGDHLPGLGFTEEDLINGDMLQTQYFIWTNQEDGINMPDEDIEAYQLGSRICEYLGFNNGIINAYHQAHRNTDKETYLKELEVLEYDILYGERYVYEGESVYSKSDMKFGVNTVAITGAEQDPENEDILIITGEHFTQYSRIYLNGEYINTEFIDGQHICGDVSGYDSEDEITIEVKQSYKGSLILQTSNELSYTLKFLERSNESEEDFENNNDNFFEAEETQNIPDIGALIEEGDNEDN